MLIRRGLTQRLMGSLTVVFPHEGGGFHLGIFQVLKEVQVQDLVAEGPIEALDVGSLGRRAGLDEVERRVVLLGPTDAGDLTVGR